MKKNALFILLLCLAAAGCADGKESKNKAVVLAFYDLVFNRHQPEEASKMYIGNEYIQHNPYVADGAEPFYTYFAGYFKENPESHVEIKRIAADGDLVFVHVHSKANKQDLGQAVVDIFRLDNGKIVEHWDVVQPVEKDSANANTMF